MRCMLPGLLHEACHLSTETKAAIGNNSFCSGALERKQQKLLLPIIAFAVAIFQTRFNRTGNKTALRASGPLEASQLPMCSNGRKKIRAQAELIGSSSAIKAM